MLVIKDYDSIPAHIPTTCSVMINTKVEKFLDDARKLNVITDEELNLLEFIENFKVDSHVVRKGKKGSEFMMFPPSSSILVEGNERQLCVQ